MHAFLTAATVKASHWRTAAVLCARADGVAATVGAKGAGGQLYRIALPDLTCPHRRSGHGVLAICCISSGGPVQKLRVHEAKRPCIVTCAEVVLAAQHRANAVLTSAALGAVARAENWPETGCSQFGVRCKVVVLVCRGRHFAQALLRAAPAELVATRT